MREREREERERERERERESTAQSDTKSRWTPPSKLLEHRLNSSLFNVINES